jgi:putative tricarboxylic transport membrane protein
LRFNNLVIGLAAITCGVLVFVTGYRMPSLPHLRFGPGFFPCLVGIGMVLAGAGLALQHLLAAKPRPPWFEAVPELLTATAATGLALMLGGVVVYILVSDELGFLITGCAVLWANLAWLWRRPAAALALSLATVVFIQLFFGSFMRVPLPMGPLEFLQVVL